MGGEVAHGESGAPGQVGVYRRHQPRGTPPYGRAKTHQDADTHLSTEPQVGNAGVRGGRWSRREIPCFHPGGNGSEPDPGSHGPPIHRDDAQADVEARGHVTAVGVASRGLATEPVLREAGVEGPPSISGQGEGQGEAR